MGGRFRSMMPSDLAKVGGWHEVGGARARAGLPPAARLAVPLPSHAVPLPSHAVPLPSHAVLSIAPSTPTSNPRATQVGAIARESLPARSVEYATEANRVELVRIFRR